MILEGAEAFGGVLHVVTVRELKQHSPRGEGKEPSEALALRPSSLKRGLNPSRRGRR
jgi:hypothetical protein